MTTTQPTFNNKRINRTARVRQLLANRPDLTPKTIAQRAKVAVTIVYDERKKMREAGSLGAKLPEVATRMTVGKSRKAVEVKAEVKAEVKPEVKETIIPKYSEKYTKAVDLIAEYKLNFNLGSAVAHILRANSDNKRADIKAAVWYLSNELLTTDL